MIEAEQLTRRYGRLTAVDSLSFRVVPGEVVGLLGPNGAGKSTVMRMISGFIAPSSGTARVCGYDVRRRPMAAKRRLGYLPEGAPSYGELTVREFLAYTAGVRGLRGGTYLKQLDITLERLHLERVLDTPIEYLSKGFRRRVGLACAILHEPEVLMLDEPTDGLDPNQKREVRALIDAMARKRTILISTHLLDEVRALCNRVLIVAHGRLLVDATPAELEARSRYHGAVSFTAAGAGVARAMLERMPEVAAVEVDPLDGRMTVLPQPGHQVLEPVQKLLQTQGLKVGEIQLERGRLEEVFSRMTRGEEDMR